MWSLPPTSATHTCIIILSNPPQNHCFNTRFTFNDTNYLQYLQPLPPTSTSSQAVHLLLSQLYHLHLDFINPDLALVWDHFLLFQQLLMPITAYDSHILISTSIPILPTPIDFLLTPIPSDDVWWERNNKNGFGFGDGDGCVSFFFCWRCWCWRWCWFWMKEFFWRVLVGIVWTIRNFVSDSFLYLIKMEGEKNSDLWRFSFLFVCVFGYSPSLKL